MVLWFNLLSPGECTISHDESLHLGLGRDQGLVSWPPSGIVSLWLQVLEACMKNCGRRLHNEVGKFRFLNELIKVVSPKVSW